MGDLLMFRYFQVLSIIPRSLLGMGQRAPVLLRFEGWVAKMATMLKYGAVTPALLSILCLFGLVPWAPLHLTLALAVTSVATILIAYVLCMWLIYRLSKHVSPEELRWCESVYKSLRMPEPFRHMNRYILASYVDRAMTAGLSVGPVSLQEHPGRLSRGLQTARKVVSFKILYRVVYSNLAVMSVGFLCLPYASETQINLLLIGVGSYTMVALSVVVAGAFVLTRKAKS
jgi:hypothetical protein